MSSTPEQDNGTELAGLSTNTSHNEMGELPMDRPGCASEAYERTASAARRTAAEVDDGSFRKSPTADSGL